MLRSLMSTCPFCQSSLSDTPLAEGRCPNCGNLLAWSDEAPPPAEIAAPASVGQPKLAAWTPPETNDPVALLKATLQRIVNRAAESDEPPKEIPPLFPPLSQPGGAPYSTNAPPIGPAISGSAPPTNSPPRRGHDSGTLDYSVTPPNFEELERRRALRGAGCRSFETDGHGSTAAGRPEFTG